MDWNDSRTVESQSIVYRAITLSVIGGRRSEERIIDMSTLLPRRRSDPVIGMLSSSS